MGLVTSSAAWSTSGSVEDGTSKPSATTNVAFTYDGLKSLGLPIQTLHSFPKEFAMGMKLRRDILGDNGVNSPDNWDQIWCDKPVHMWVSINGSAEQGEGAEANITARYLQVMALVAETQGGVELLTGHSGENGEQNLKYQDVSAVYENGLPTAKEHFGYTDGISDPFFKGKSSNPENVIGAGKPTLKDPSTLAGWEPLETGEFILGYRDEMGEYPISPDPRLLSFNGTFMVYRKLHENVGSFKEYMEDVGKDFPGGKEALAAKFSGRWRNGAPITTFPTQKEADEFISKLNKASVDRDSAETDQEKTIAAAEFAKLKMQLTAFNYNNDIPGAKCPVGAHMRRVNPRGALQFGVKKAFNDNPGALVNRRRILRRGLPYGEVKDPTSNKGNHGIIFMALNASIERQFEFVQQQWVNYGNDFKLANEKDPLLGNHGVADSGKGKGKMIVPNDPDGSNAPFFCGDIPNLVNTLGGDYFFIPSLTALRMIAQGIVDPT
jgi:deferrochelatase/peroxidase EfeB